MGKQKFDPNTGNGIMLHVVCLPIFVSKYSYMILLDFFWIYQVGGWSIVNLSHGRIEHCSPGVQVSRQVSCGICRGFYGVAAGCHLACGQSEKIK